MKDYKDWKNEDLKLFEDRKSGAQRIASESLSKGGAAQLTSWHFKAKIPQYNLVLSALKNENAEAHAKSKAKQFLAKLTRIDQMSQKEFQETMGELEVWGETFIQLRSPTNY